MQKELPVRKNIRLHGYDYSKAGCYFITICVKGMHEMLGEIVVGDGVLDVPRYTTEIPYVKLSEYGIITEKYIAALDKYYEYITIPKYVIMPNHIHLLVVLNNKTLAGNKHGTSRTPSPTNAVIPSFVSTLKRFIHKDCGFVLFQRAYHDNIIRNEEEYKHIWRYIDKNPSTWAEDRYYKCESPVEM